MNEKMTNSYSEVKIEALNKIIMAHSSNFVPAKAGVTLSVDEKKTVRKIREELALRGISIKMEGGKYGDVSEKVANGYFLNQEDQVQLAILNDIHQTYFMNLRANQKVPGEIRASVNDIKRRLNEHGISIRQDGDLFIVDSMMDSKTNDLGTAENVIKD